MLEWKDVLPLVLEAFGGQDPASAACILEFLRVLAEEVNEGRKINLTVRSTAPVSSSSPMMRF
jgi:transportin-3